MALNTDRQRYEQELEKAEAKWRELHGRKLYAWVVIVVGGAIALAYLLHRNWADNDVLGALGLMAVVGGGLWLRDLTSQLSELSRRSTTLREVTKERAQD